MIRGPSAAFSGWEDPAMTWPGEIWDLIRNVTEFTVTEDHLTLLRHARVSWDEAEYGSPSIDAKRPYGWSDVEGSIAQLLDWPDRVADRAGHGRVPARPLHAPALADHRLDAARVRILILGGTGEARELAAELVAQGVDFLSSLAGRVQQPRLPDGPVRVGGFGGAAGLAEFLTKEQITAVIDATHPFAGTITANANQAAAQAGLPLLILRRPEWPADPTWHLVPDITTAAATVRAWPGESVFLTTGRRDLDVFAPDDRHRFLVRAVDPPAGATPPRMTLILDRGPYTVEGESALMREHGVGLLVTKNSGGPMTEAKLTAARNHNIAILMVQRPPLPENSQTVSTVADAVRWISPGTGAA
jgi:precorrin-6A/cobalt-precorrin-6A reductase